MGAGRKRKQGKPREANGRVQRTQAERDPRLVVVEARQRIHNISKEDAAKAEACDEIGLALLRGHITRDQAEAALEYEKVCEAHRVALGSKAMRSASDFSGSGGFDGSDGTDPAYVARCQRARARYAESRRALLDADPLAQMVLHGVLFEHVPVRTDSFSFPRLVLALNALVSLYDVGKWRAGREKSLDIVEAA